MVPKPAYLRLTRGRAALILALITCVGGGFRFYNLAWGAPYYHFHIDEHYVFMGAELLRRGMAEAANSLKFFMYSPGPMYLVNVLRAVYELLAHPLDLTVPRDEVTYMVLGRAISATFGTLTIPLVYAIATRVAGRVAGLLAAAYLAVTVIHLRDSHFFTVDISMTFFIALTWLAMVRMADRGGRAAGALTGLAWAGALLSKYSAAFLGLPIAFAHLLSPDRPNRARPWSAWIRWTLIGLVPLVVAIVTFLVLDPMVIRFFDRFREDVRMQITEPLTGASQPIFFGHFAGVTHPRLYWFTNLLLWGMGPALELWAIAGLIWLVARRTKAAAVSAAVPIAYFLVAGGSVAPFVRYTIPLAMTLTVAAGVLSADLLERQRSRIIGLVATALVLGSSTLYAAAYMNVFRQRDARLVAAQYINTRVPPDSRILVEPSHNIPPMGSYLHQMNFYRDYVLWRGETRHDKFQLLGLDTYRLLYNSRNDHEKRRHIEERLAEADWIVMDDTFVQFYEHLPETDHHIVKQYYRDLFGGKLDFDLQRTFKVYPRIFGWTIRDDGAELSFRLFDHPTIYVFRRRP
jgi:dolichyl-phosphate-mannose-protein mannosyltransferase